MSWGNSRRGLFCRGLTFFSRSCLPPQPSASLPFRTPPPSETSPTSPSFAGVLRPIHRERNRKILKKDGAEKRRERRTPTHALTGYPPRDQPKTSAPTVPMNGPAASVDNRWHG